MKQIYQTLVLALLPAILFTGCGKPETPQDVTKAFWEAIIDNDSGTASELSTLVDESGFDGYSLDWTGADTSWGRVSLDGDEARITTVIRGLDQEEDDALETTTYLVQINDQWLIDYHRTGDSLAREVSVNHLFEEFQAFGDELRSRISTGSDRATEEMSRMADELSELSAEAERELSAVIEDYRQQLEEHKDKQDRESRQVPPDSI